LLFGVASATTVWGLVLITHAETADRVIVQYAAQQVDTNATREFFADPHHPHTAALLAALSERANGRRLPAIPGVVPGPFTARAAACSRRVAPAFLRPAMMPSRRLLTPR
jgi:dipeptide transport system ATP-binding protein